MADDRLDENEEGILGKLGIGCVADALRIPGLIVSQDTRSAMKVVEVGDRQVFLKTFDYRTSHKRWRYAFRKSHCLRELGNFDFLRGLGIPCPTPLASGESRSWLRPLVSFLVTESLDGYQVLSEFLEGGELNQEQERSILGILSQQVAAMHKAHYIDRDLKFRNILVNLNSPIDVAHVDCAQGRVRSGSVFVRGVVHDLSTLDKHAPQFFSPWARLRFLANYKRHRVLSATETRTIAQAVLQRRAELWRRGGQEEVLHLRRDS